MKLRQVVSFDSYWSWGKNSVLWILMRSKWEKKAWKISAFISFNTWLVWQFHYTLCFHFSLRLLNAELSIYSWRGIIFIPLLHRIINSEINLWNKKNKCLKCDMNKIGFNNQNLSKEWVLTSCCSLMNEGGRKCKLFNILPILWILMAYYHVSHFLSWV